MQRRAFLLSCLALATTFVAGIAIADAGPTSAPPTVVVQPAPFAAGTGLPPASLIGHDQTQYVNLSPATPRRDAREALVFYGNQQHLTLVVDADYATGMAQAKAWVAANTPGATIHLLPSQSTFEYHLTP
jgi:hypothetical protein